MALNDKKNKLVIFGVKNMAVEIREMAELYYAKTFQDLEMVYFSEEYFQKASVEAETWNLFYTIGFGGTNRKLCIEALSKYPHFQAFSIIHPSAAIAPSAKIGRGCVIMPHATISTNAVVGDHCVVNYNASVGHDSVLAGNNFIQPGARISGNCQIGEGSLIGSNSFVYQNVRIGKECLIDAMAYIHDEVGDRMLISPRYEKPVSRDELEKNKIPMWE